MFLNFQSDSVTIGIVKHFKKIYRIETLIKSFAILKQQEKYSNLKSLLIGDGEERNNYITLENKLGIIDCIDFTRFSCNDQLHPEYQKIDIMVISSIRESFGISILEGACYEIPVIASDISIFNEVGTSETITYFEAGNLADLAFKIKGCIQYPNIHKDKAQKARKRVIELFSKQACIEKKVNLYKQLVNK